jgi:hypothetical protein
MILGGGVSSVARGVRLSLVARDAPASLDKEGKGEG